MGYSDVSDPTAVFKAMEEYDQNPSAFLTKYGFSASTTYLLVHEGREYPPKAILGVAHKYQYPSKGPLANNEFSGGESATNRVLSGMDFDVVDASQKIRFLNSIRTLKLGSVRGFGRAPHKPLLMLLAIKHLVISSPRLRPASLWVAELQDILDEVVPEIGASPTEPIWRLEPNIWTMQNGELEIRPDPPGDPNPRTINSDATKAGFTPEAFALLSDFDIRREVVDLLIDELLSDLSAQKKQVLREMFPNPATWWVNQGKTYNEERDLGIVWAPLLQKNNFPAAHHTVLSEMKNGDVVIHYSKGSVRALGRVTYGAIEKQNPFVRADNEWEKSGREVGVTYFELDEPIELSEIRNIPSGNGPFNKHGAINQGYMFALPTGWPDAFRRQFKNRWPNESPWGSSPSSKAINGRIQELAKWLMEFRQLEDFKSQEIDYKLEIFSRVNAANQSDAVETDKWVDGLRSALTTRNNLVDFRVIRGFLAQTMDDVDLSKQVVTNLINSKMSIDSRIDEFADWNSKNSGSGIKLSLISLLLASFDPLNCPVYNTTPVSIISSLIGREASKGRASERYQEFVQLIDELLQVCATIRSEDLKPIANRLEMQSAMWMLRTGKPHESWSTAKQRDFLTFIGGEGMPHHLEELADEVLLDVTFLSEIEELLEDKKQVIFYGPPGAGKTYIALKLAETLSKENSGEGSVELVQFHPSYAYEDFVEGFRPTEDGKFVLKKGKLLSIAERALESPEKRFFLIIDEINRGNVAKVFGEMYFLLEYRNHEIQLQYSDDSFKMPKNLYFIGTMNSADRSIGLIDSALRRRFHFVSFYPTEVEMKNLLRDWLKENAPNVSWVADAVDEVNSQIDRNFAIGPSHFMKPNLDESLARKIWNRSVLPYVEDLFFNQQSKVDEFRLENLRTLKRLEQDKISAEASKDQDDAAAEAS